MAKNKARHSKESEFQLGKIRALTKEITHLKRRIKQLERLEYSYFNKREPQEERVRAPKLPICVSCNEGQMETITLVGRVIEKCNYCDFRTPAKKMEKE